MNNPYTEQAVRAAEISQVGKNPVSYPSKSWDAIVEVSVSSGIFTLPHSKVSIESSPAFGNLGIRLFLDEGLLSDDKSQSPPADVVTSTSRQGVRRRAAPTIPGSGQSSTSRAASQHTSMFLEIVSVGPHPEKTNAIVQISNEHTSSFSQLQNMAMRVNRPAFVPYSNTFTKNVLIFRFPTSAEALDFMFAFRSMAPKHQNLTQTMAPSIASTGIDAMETDDSVPSSFVQLPIQKQYPAAAAAAAAAMAVPPVAHIPGTGVSTRGAGATGAPQTTATTTATYQPSPQTRATATTTATSTTSGTNANTGGFEISRPTLIGGTGVHMKNLGVQPVAGTATGIPVPFAEYSYRPNLDTAATASTVRSLYSVPTVSTLSSGSSHPTEATAQGRPADAFTPSEEPITKPITKPISKPEPVLLDLQRTPPPPMATVQPPVSTGTAAATGAATSGGASKQKKWKKMFSKFWGGKKDHPTDKTTTTEQGSADAQSTGPVRTAKVGKLSKKEEARLAAEALQSLQVGKPGGMSSASISSVVPGSFTHHGHVGSKGGLTPEESVVLSSVDIDNLPLEIKEYMRQIGVRKKELRQDKVLLAVLLSTMGYNASHFRGGGIMKPVPTASSTESATIRTPSPISGTSTTTNTAYGRKETSRAEKPSIPGRRKKSVAFQEPEHVGPIVQSPTLPSNQQQHLRPTLQDQPSPVAFNRREGMSGVTVLSYKYAEKSYDPFDASIGALPVITEASIPSVSPADDYKFQTIVGKGTLGTGPSLPSVPSIPSHSALRSPSQTLSQSVDEPYLVQPPPFAYISPPESDTGYIPTVSSPELAGTAGEIASTDTFQTARSTIPSQDMDASPEFVPRDSFKAMRPLGATAAGGMLPPSQTRISGQQEPRRDSATAAATGLAPSGSYFFPSAEAVTSAAGGASVSAPVTGKTTEQQTRDSQPIQHTVQTPQPSPQRANAPAALGPAPVGILSAIKGFDKSKLAHVDKSAEPQKSRAKSPNLDSSMVSQLQSIVEARRKALGGRVTLTTQDSDSDSDWSVD